MSPVLKRPTRPLPKKFRRPLTSQTRSFVQRRHKRVREHRNERWRRLVRRCKTVAIDRLRACRRWLKFILPGIGVIVFCLLLFSPLLHIREIRVVRTEGRVDLPGVLESLSSLYDKHLLFVSAREVAARVREVVPDANEVIVSKNYPSKLSVQITLDPLVARIRIESPADTPSPSPSQPSQPSSPSVPSTASAPSGSGSRLTRTGSGAAGGDFLTSRGLLVSVAHPVFSQPLPTIRIVDWSVRPTPMTQLFSIDVLDRIKRAEEALTLEFGQSIRLRTVYLRAREFHLDTATISFWFDMRIPLEVQLRQFRTFLKVVKLPDVKSYVDLRLMGRVVYK